MTEQQCKDCKYFLQHYTFNKRKLFCVCCGHCTFSRVKRRLPDSNVCENFVPNPTQEDAFVSKEYLSKELLQYMLNLEPLPEIVDRG